MRLSLLHAVEETTFSFEDDVLLEGGPEDKQDTACFLRVEPETPLRVLNAWNAEKEVKLGGIDFGRMRLCAAEQRTGRGKFRPCIPSLIIVM